ncbi:MAG: hypothetical protein ACYDHU_11430 [Acidimicrobiales bacterium]
MATGASMALVIGMLGALLSALLGTTAAYAGSVTTTYSGTAPVVGHVVVPVTVSDTAAHLPATLQVGTSASITPQIKATIPATLFQDISAAGQTVITVSSAELVVKAHNLYKTTAGTKITSQTAVAATTQVPVVLPVNATTLANGGTATIVMKPQAWTAGPTTGASTLTPGAITLHAIVTFTVNPKATVGTFDSTTATSPPEPAVVQNQTATVSNGQCTTINVLAGATDLGATIKPTTTAIVTGPAEGTATAHPTGLVTYCATGTGTPATATFTFNVGNTDGQTSNTATATVTISYSTCSAGSGNATGGSTGTLGTCSLHQIVLLPVEPGQIILSQTNGLPIDRLGAATCQGATTFGIKLNGQAQIACGVFSPLTVTNATGLTTGWTLTGQTTDFVDPADPGLTCDTTGTYSNHCIPGENLSWIPQAAVTSNIVPGDTGAIAAGPIAPTILTKTGPLAAPPNASGATLTALGAALAALLQTGHPGTAPKVTNTSPILQPVPTQANPVVEPSPAKGGLHTAPATLCTTAAGHSGGTFVCGAGLLLQVPASAAEPIAGSHTPKPAYQATVTFTLS